MWMMFVAKWKVKCSYRFLVNLSNCTKDLSMLLPLLAWIRPGTDWGCRCLLGDWRYPHFTGKIFSLLAFSLANILDSGQNVPMCVFFFNIHTYVHRHKAIAQALRKGVRFTLIVKSPYLIPNRCIVSQNIENKRIPS